MYFDTYTCMYIQFFKLKSLSSNIAYIEPIFEHVYTMLYSSQYSYNISHKLYSLYVSMHIIIVSLKVIKDKNQVFFE